MTMVIGYIFNIFDDDFSDQEGWTYYMEESTGTRSTGTVETNRC